jgi:chromatin remodeling complex protein RSC6
MSTLQTITTTTAAPTTRVTAIKKKTLVKKKVKELVVDSDDDDDAAVIERPPTTSSVDDDVDREKKIEQRLDETIDELKEFKAMTRGMCNDFIERLQDAKKEIRQLRKQQKKPRIKKDPKKPCVFEINTRISDELCVFFNEPIGTEMTRNEVTHKLHVYCEEHGLMDPTNRRIIHPDEKFKALLKNYPENPTKDQQLTWLNIQSFIKHHYPDIAEKQ